MVREHFSERWNWRSRVGTVTKYLLGMEGDSIFVLKVVWSHWVVLGRENQICILEESAFSSGSNI